MKLSELPDYDPEIRPKRWKWAFIAATALIVAGPLIGWAVAVAVAPAKGAGDVRRDVNTSTNRIDKQELFEQRIADVRSLDQRAALALDDYHTAGCKSPTQAMPGDDGQALTTCQKLYGNYTGARNRCVETLNNYNADARKISAARFRAADLPPSLPDPDDTAATDCQGDPVR